MDRDAVEPLDDLDRIIVDALARDGRITSTDLAGLAGIAKGMAAGRVRRLIDSEVVRVTAVFDVDAAGYQWQTNCFIKSTGAPASRIAETLATMPQTWMVSSALGRCDVVAVFMFADKLEMSAFLTTQLPGIVGIDQFECDVVVRPMWYEPLATNVIVHSRDVMEPVGVGEPIPFPNPVVEIDALDNSIIRSLRADGRRSNRHIGRDLDVSEGTVRSRIKRLQDANLMRIVAWIDPLALGRHGHVLYLRILLGSTSPDAVAIELARIDQLSSTSAVVGRPNISAMALTADSHDTHQILHAVRAIDGVTDVEIHELVQVHFYRNHFVRVSGRHRPSRSALANARGPLQRDGAR